jgi:hypothetical protein
MWLGCIKVGAVLGILIRKVYNGLRLSNYLGADGCGFLITLFPFGSNEYLV